MYINPFLVGVATTILVEVAVVVVLAIFSIKKTGGNNNDGKQH